MRFYGELLEPRSSPKLEDHPLSAVRGCLFNIFPATLHIGGRSSIRNLRTRHIQSFLLILHYCPEDDKIRSKHVATTKYINTHYMRMT
jgi:hypothetical protein